MRYSLAQSFFNSGVVLLRHRAAKDLLFKYKVFFFTMLKFDPNVSILAMAAGLLFMLSFYLNLLLNGLSVRDLRIYQIDGNAEFCLQLADDNIKMLLSNTRNN